MLDSFREGYHGGKSFSGDVQRLNNELKSGAGSEDKCKYWCPLNNGPL